MEDYSKVAAVEEKLSRPLWRKLGERSVRTSLLWREACSARFKIKRKETRSNSSKSFWKKGAADARLELK
jgi:hypothetical protein